MEEKVQTIHPSLMRDLVSRAKESSRGRLNHNFHPSMESNLHRFLNVMCRGTYFTPHRHAKPPKAEAFLVLEGEVGFLIFDEQGKVLQRLRLSAHPVDRPHYAGMGIDLPPGVWHTLVVLSDVAVCYEVKPGPYEVTADKEFVDWAPHEGDPGAQAALAKWQMLFETES